MPRPSRLRPIYPQPMTPGVALAGHGDLNSAIGKLKAANQRGPHWADPLKAWGDVLVKQGNIREGRAKYEKAFRYALNWA